MEKKNKKYKKVNYNIVYNIVYNIIMEKYDRDFYGNVTINGITYSADFMRDNIPYIIEFNVNTHDYFFISRSGLYIGHNTTNITDIIPNVVYADYTRIYLFNDICPPWNTQMYMEMFIQKFNEQTAGLGYVSLGNYNNPFGFLQYNVA
jgi:hypothetical protein